MRSLGIGCRAMLPLAVVAAALCLPSKALGQAAGVAVDAEGVLRAQTFPDPGGQLTRQRIAAAKAALDAELATLSPLRKISLSRLEKALAGRQGAATDQMRYLAGLLRVKYVFCYPDTGDVVIAGPAEGWYTNPAGRVVGITSGRPIVQLQDLVVALRAFPPGGKAAGLVGCSIDPTAEGLASMQRFLQTTGSRIPPNNLQVIQYLVNGLQTSLGPEEISVFGIPPNTHFAQKMVEADYRMKLISIDLEKPPVQLVSYVRRVGPSQLGRNALQRFYFTPDYKCVRLSQDGLAVELVGDGVKLVGEGETVGPDGQRHAAAQSSRASQAFVTSFTKKYPELAERSPVFAELRNLIDLLVAAAGIQRHDYYAKAGWEMALLGDEKSFAVQTYHAPKQAPPAVNAIRRGQRLITPIGGGVTIHPANALNSDNLLADEKGKVTEARRAVKLELAKGQWWWD